MLSKKLQTNLFQISGMIFLISVLIAACVSPQPERSITDTTWQWTELVETEPASQSLVPDPENYTLVLETGGSVSVKADCNMISGSYNLAGNSLSFEFGPSTMALCSEESLDQLYVEMLNNVKSFALQDGSLVLELKDNAGRITFNEG